jgi:predicted transcriptional regulator
LGDLHILLSDETEKRLRTALAQRKKGDLSIAIEEAIKDWLEKHGAH